jgi:hypothetical protein
MNQQNVIHKLTWRLKELPPATGLGEAFWRKMVQLKKIPTRKVEGAILIADEDLREFLRGRQESDEAEAA